MPIIKLSRKRVNSILIACFLAEEIICRIIGAFITIPKMSVILVFVLCIIALINNGFPTKINKIAVIAIMLILSLFLVSYINGGIYIGTYISRFIVFGFSAIYLLSLNFENQIIFSKTSHLYFLYLIIYLLFDRYVFLNSSNYSNLQMGLAYSFLHMAIVGTIECVYYRSSAFNQFIDIFNILCGTYFLLFDCHSRGPILCLGFFIIALVLMRMRKKYAIIAGIVVFCIVIIFLVNMQNVLQNIEIILSSSNIHILALDKTIALARRSQNIDNGRLPLYQYAVHCILQSPLWGNGIGFFEKNYCSQTGELFYIHQYLLQILCEFGMIGMTVTLVFLRHGFISIFDNSGKRIDDYKLLGFSLFCLSIPMLMITSAYWLSPLYWLFFAWNIFYNKHCGE